jgi:hypothetical protein
VNATVLIGEYLDAVYITQSLAYACWLFRDFGSNNNNNNNNNNSARVVQLVEALRYKPEGRGFDFRWCHWNFSLT